MMLASNVFAQSTTVQSFKVPLPLAYGGTGQTTLDGLRTIIGAQSSNANLAAIATLANGAGWLYNNGSGVFSYSTPPLTTRTDLGLATGDSPVFAGLTLTGYSGFCKATAGIISCTALADEDIPDTISLTNITQIMNRSHTNLTDIGNLTHATIDSYLDQSVKQAASPVFVTAKFTGLTDGYVPYHVSDASGLADSPIRINGASVGVGGSPAYKFVSVAPTAPAIVALSGNLTQWTSLGMGRTTVEGFWGMVALDSSNQFMTGTMAGDMVIRVEGATNKLHFGIGTSGAPEMSIVEKGVEINATNIAVRPTVGTMTINSNFANANGTGQYNSMVLSNGGTDPSTNIMGPAISFKSAVYGATTTYSTGRILSYFDNSGGANPGYPGAVLALQTPTADNIFTTAAVVRNGRLGIGTTNPTYRLHLDAGTGAISSAGRIYLDLSAEAANAAQRLLNITFNGYTTGTIGQFFASGNTFLNAALNLPANSIGLTSEAPSGTLLLAAVGASGDIRFNTGGWAAANERMRILSGGNVGIGTNNPTVQLHVKGASAAVSVEYPSGKWATMLAGVSGAGFGFADTGYFSIGRIASLYATPTNDIYINSSGNVGIGTTSPTEKFSVTGNIKYSGTTGGLVRKTAEATCTTTAATTCVVTLSIPTAVRLLGAQLRVDTALTAGETWSAAYSGGSTTTIAAVGTAVAKDTKVNKLHVDEITTNTTDITITRDAGSFTAGGVIRAIVYYETVEAMANAP